MEWFALPWKVLVARGVVGILFGLLALTYPISTAISLVVLWGVWALLDGISGLVAAFSAEAGAPKLMYGVLGVLAVLAGLSALAHPGLTAATLTWFLGIWLIVRGAVDLVGSLMGNRVGPLALSVVSSALSIVAGVIFAANPGRSAVTLAAWLGLIALMWGVVFLVTGLLARREMSDTAPAPTVPA